ncbi:MAG: DUF4268 domain-containing protein [Panacibacter sp.]
MYSRREASQLKQRFWTAFGQYMLPVFSAEGEHINWINYKTGAKDIYFRMNADNKKATIGITLTHKDAELQALYFDQFKQLKAMLEDALQEEWIWLLHTADEHEKLVSSIYAEINNVSVFNKAEWPQLISFFKPRIIALDAFWSNAKYAFEAM